MGCGGWGTCPLRRNHVRKGLKKRKGEDFEYGKRVGVPLIGSNKLGGWGIWAAQPEKEKETSWCMRTENANAP